MNFTVRSRSIFIPKWWHLKYEKLTDSETIKKLPQEVLHSMLLLKQLLHLDVSLEFVAIDEMEMEQSIGRTK